MTGPGPHGCSVVARRGRHRCSTTRPLSHRRRRPKFSYSYMCSLLGAGCVRLSHLCRLRCKLQPLQTVTSFFSSLILKSKTSLGKEQMHGKTASLKSLVASSEKLERIQETPDYSLPWPESLKDEEIKKYSREGTLQSKSNQQYHKLFKDIPLEEVVLKACSCALQRDLLLQGRLYISPNWLCFHASLFGKDIKVVIPVLSVQMIKKHKMARLLPNGLAITTNTSQKYIFVSMLSRDSVYDMLRRVCTHLQPSSKKSLSVREFPEEPECESLEVLIPEMKWRKVCHASRSLSLPDNIPCIPRESMDATDNFFSTRKPPGAENTVCEADSLEEEHRSNEELRLWDYRLLKVFFVLICFLVMSSSYLAFRISQLEQQICSLNWDGSTPGHR
ncbi:PREDICTED: GRAM domain-containing protein 2 [Elephantulus edwardii]|uniref:GRAM domain-containing protein 2 n=1 Tax=Elephantulus edwardii TaxID=28737 RepID=UPI0003F0806A|nr:PREDICTED: GRAM domain-containing protein 2 [Elephantulus edwardii]